MKRKGPAEKKAAPCENRCRPELRQVVAERGPEHSVHGMRSDAGSAVDAVTVRPRVAREVGILQTPMEPALLALVDFVPEAECGGGNRQADTVCIRTVSGRHFKVKELPRCWRLPASQSKSETETRSRKGHVRKLLHRFRKKQRVSALYPSGRQGRFQRPSTDSGRRYRQCPLRSSAVLPDSTRR
jgi:hypothetical protein